MIQGKKVLYVPNMLDCRPLTIKILQLLASDYGFSVTEVCDKPEARNYLSANSCDLMIITLVGVWYAPNDDFCTIGDVLDFSREQELNISNTRILLLLPQNLQPTESEKELLIENQCSYVQLPLNIDTIPELVLPLLA